MKRVIDAPVPAQRTKTNRKSVQKRTPKSRTSLTAYFTRVLAKQASVGFVPTYADRWANTVTRLAGDNPSSDSTDDLLVALTRAGKLSPQEMTQMVIAHHRSVRGL